MTATVYQPLKTSAPISYNVTSQTIQELLLAIGFPQHVYGYNYVMYSLELILENPEILHHITKELYPQIAKHFDSTPARVERAIRTAIHITWLYGNLPMINTIFGNTIRSDKGVPTNTQLLAGLYFFIKHKNP